MADTKYALVTSAHDADATATIEGVVDPGRIAEEVRRIVDQMATVFKNPLGLPLKSMEVALTVTLEGSIGFLGTGGKATGEGSITLTFEKPDPAP